MPTRKEERERMRQERLAAQRAASSSEQRRLYLGYAVAGVIVVAIIAGIAVAIAGGGDSDPASDPGNYSAESSIKPQIGVVPDVPPDDREGTAPPEQQIGELEEAARVAKCDLQLNLEDEGSTHFLNEDKEVDYKTNPPTSGDHYGNSSENASGAIADGAYLEMPPITRLVHSLEHGRVELQYSPDLSEQEQLELKGLFLESPDAMIMFPNPDMPYDVAVTAWRNLAGCKTYDGAATLDLIRVFRDIYRGQGPEPFPISVG